MSRTIKKGGIAAALLCAALAVAPAAQANWTTNGAGNFAASLGVAGNGAVQFTYAGGNIGIACGSNGGTGRLAASQVSGAAIATGIGLFSTCRIIGQTAGVACGPSSVNAARWDSASNSVYGTITGINCRVVAPALGCGNGTTLASGIVITGAITSANYNNTTQRLTTPVGGSRNLNVSTGAGCPASGGTSFTDGRFTAAGGGDVVHTVTSTFRPNVTA